jgi:hypothetical protein
METDDLLKRAWTAVEKAGIPDHLQAIALQEAIAHLRAPEDEGAANSVRDTKTPARSPALSSSRMRRDDPGVDTSDPVDVDAFFERLSHESGIDKSDLRDVLHLTSDGKVQVSPPTKDLGDSVAEQARNVIALVASGRAYGLNEEPVNADAVRREAERKRCYQAKKFAAPHLRTMKGFNAGATRAEIRLTSKWIDEFKAAVGKAQGDSPSSDE